jgi:hypothetical protein
MTLIHLNDVLPIGQPELFKAHFATWNGTHRPLDTFLRDRNAWDDWNRYYPGRDDFNRPHIISWLEFHQERHTWLFGGIYDVLGRENGAYIVQRSPLHEAMVGRLKIVLKIGRARRVRLEAYLPDMVVAEILREPYSGAAFPGYEDIDLPFRELELILRNEKPDWRGALQNVKGVYLITDQSNGRKYVGSAYGIQGIWSRWRAYVDTGHGWNAEFSGLVAASGIEYARENFKFTLLEHRPARVDDKVIIQREGFWKQALLTRGAFGYNLN